MGNGALTEQGRKTSRPGVRRRASPTGDKSAAAPPGSLPPPLDDTRLRQRAIGVGLRRLFDAMIEEPVPEEFLELLRRADRQGEPE